VATLVTHKFLGIQLRIWIFYGTAWNAGAVCIPAFLAALKFCFKTCVAMKFVDDDDDDGLVMRKLSVRLSVKHVNCDKTEERSVKIFIPYKRSFVLVFWEEEWLVGATPSTWNFGSTGPIGVKSPIFNRYSPVAPQP